MRRGRRGGADLGAIDRGDESAESIAYSDRVPTDRDE